MLQVIFDIMLIKKASFYCPCLVEYQTCTHPGIFRKCLVVPSCVLKQVTASGALTVSICSLVLVRPEMDAVSQMLREERTGCVPSTWVWMSWGWSLRCPTPPPSMYTQDIHAQVKDYTTLEYRPTKGHCVSSSVEDNIWSPSSSPHDTRGMVPVSWSQLPPGSRCQILFNFCTDIPYAWPCVLHTFISNMPCSG